MPALTHKQPIHPLPGIIITADKSGWTARIRQSGEMIATHASLGGLLERLIYQTEYK